MSVTGTGTVNAPVGAWVLAPALAGRGEFTLNVQRAAGDPAPVGHATWVWVFGASRYEIASTQVSQLLTGGAAARIDGACAINGVGGFHFTVLVVAARGPDGSDTQRLRLQVRDAASGTVVLDTQPGTELTVDLETAGELAAGRITITGPARD